MQNSNPAIGFIGFGEVAFNFAAGLLNSGIEKLSAYDKAISNPNCDILKNRAKELNVDLLESIEALVDISDIIISAVHGNVALEVAINASRSLKSGQLYVDINNTSPKTKLKIADIINASNAKFVDLELFEVPARIKHKSYLLASGEGAEIFINTMKQYGMMPKLVEGPPNKASEIKTLANIYMKGIQALCLELAVGATKAGVDLELIAPLIVKPVENIPAENQLAFWIIRGILHAGRKTVELEDINQALRNWDTEPIMMDAAQKRLRWFAQFDISNLFSGDISFDECNNIIKYIEEVSRQKGIKFN